MRPIPKLPREDAVARNPRPSGRMPLSRAMRTDPTLYQWDRLSPEQQANVMAAIGNTPRQFRPWIARPILLAVVLAAVLLTLIVAILLLHR
jgi:hypothetical protein